MIVKSLEVNFRKLKDANFQFANNINIISGHNGTMKSTILGLIAQPFNNSRSTDTDDSHNPDIFKSIDGTYLEGTFRKNFKLAFPEYDKPDSLLATLYFYKPNLSENDKFSFKLINRITKKNAKPLPRIWNTDGREKGQGYIKGIPVSFLYMDRLFPIGKINDFVESDDPLTDDELKLYSEWYKSIFIQQSNNNIISVSSVSSSVKSTAAPIYSNRDYRTISAGEDVIGKILVTILSFRRVKEQLGADYKGSILLIDEVESSLHPPAQKKLLKLLNKLSKKYDIQCFFTTHSLDIIEEAYKMRNLTLKDRNQSNNISILYLEDCYDKIKICPNINFLSIKNHLGLLSEDSPKLKVYTEDKESVIMIQNLIHPEYLENVDIISTDIGCNELIRLAINKKINDIENSIIVVDGDSRSDYIRILKGYNKQKSDINNLVFLPSDKNPENYILDFLKSLPPEDSFWEFNKNKSYSKIHMDNYCSDYNMTDRTDAKRWFNNNLRFWGKNASVLFKRLKEICIIDIYQFNNDFIEAYNNLATKFLIDTIDINLNFPDSKNEINTYTKFEENESYVIDYLFNLAPKDGSNFRLSQLDDKVFSKYNSSKYNKNNPLLTHQFKQKFSNLFEQVHADTFRYK